MADARRPGTRPSFIEDPDETITNVRKLKSWLEILQVLYQVAYSLRERQTAGPLTAEELELKQDATRGVEEIRQQVMDYLKTRNAQTYNSRIVPLIDKFEKWFKEFSTLNDDPDATPIGFSPGNPVATEQDDIDDPDNTGVEDPVDVEDPDEDAAENPGGEASDEDAAENPGGEASGDTRASGLTGSSRPLDDDYDSDEMLGGNVLPSYARRIQMALRLAHSRL